ncbi:hypothetical protein JCM19037_4137 [Geomicrobium sp. JCM 19037]|uniref:helix-turn-helix domain-containing protein n=1 Tax=Geomicrobium sp. JCM 19037 TaxID=1460634 RepID=UPI00045F2125|nr:helix-turn-helix domain-containing protein [Geomicrobium sp. JCM 19037]GAK05626.1 hypothetical protein JCM19037_4137 [Geomicrobium sp. JCM 19037]
MSKSLTEYPEVMEPKHVQEFLNIGEKQTYELLNSEPKPFHYIRVGRRIKISKDAFEKWFTGTP